MMDEVSWCLSLSHNITIRCCEGSYLEHSPDMSEYTPTVPGGREDHANLSTSGVFGLAEMCWMRP